MTVVPRSCANQQVDQTRALSCATRRTIALHRCVGLMEHPDCALGRLLFGGLAAAQQADRGLRSISHVRSTARRPCPARAHFGT